MSNDINQASSTNVSKERIILEVFLMNGLQIPLTILYGVFSHDPEHYESFKCVDLLYYSKMLFYLLCVGVCISIIISSIVLYAILSGTSSNLHFPLGLAFLFKAILNCLGLAMTAFFVLICIAYAKDEPCGNLRTLNLFFIIFVGISLGLGVLALLFAGCTILCAICFINVSRGNESNQREYQNMELERN